MSQTPITVTYSLEEILVQINQKLDVLQKDVTDIKIGQIKLEAELTGKIDKQDIQLTGRIDKLESEVTGRIDKLEAELKGDIKALETEVKGIGKRLDIQEFINRSVVVGFVLALTAGAIKLFFLNIPN
ncbi:Bdr protein [Anabaena minutissima FACHB-250]|nr:Bdr protein [Anabaena minutissima FACHB-250]